MIFQLSTEHDGRPIQRPKKYFISVAVGVRIERQRVAENNAFVDENSLRSFAYLYLQVDDIFGGLSGGAKSCGIPYRRRWYKIQTRRGGFH